jgi:Rrf2 family protein
VKVTSRLEHSTRAVKVSSRAEYGMRALVDLALHYGEGYVQSHEIAARQGLPESYLNQIMTSLRRAGLVTSKRGPAGGHALSRAPVEITLRQAFEVLEEGAAPWWCVEVEDPDCEYAPGCGVRPIWMAMKAAAEGVLDRLTLQDISRTAAVPAKR